MKDAFRVIVNTNRIMEACRERGIPLYALCQEAGYSHTYLSERKCHGKKEFGDSGYCYVRKAFAVTVGNILGENFIEEEPVPVEAEYLDDEPTADDLLMARLDRIDKAIAELREAVESHYTFLCATTANSEAMLDELCEMWKGEEK